MDNLTLAAANNALTGFGVIGERVAAYKPLLDAQMIRPDGKPDDIGALLAALDLEISRRLDAGTFN